MLTSHFTFAILWGKTHLVPKELVSMGFPLLGLVIFRGRISTSLDYLNPVPEIQLLTFIIETNHSIMVG